MKKKIVKFHLQYKLQVGINGWELVEPNAL